METINTLTPSEAAVAGGIVGGVFAAVAVCVLIWYVLQIIACWRMFEKAGEPGWKTLIPIYNNYIMFKIVDMKAWFWWMFGISVVFSIISAANGCTDTACTSTSPLLLFSAFVFLIIAIVCEVIYSLRTSRAFGHGIGFAIGLFFFQPIFLMIIGYGKSKYNKKKIRA